MSVTESTAPPVAGSAVASVRITPDAPTVLENLGLLQDLAGSWRGHGFNLIARPDFEENANLYLQLNQTHETLQVEAIGSAIPNRGFQQNDIELFGLTYLQKISDRTTGGALHIEPGLWVTQPATTYPAERPPADAQIVARMGSIPHGTTVLAQGVAEPFSGAPTLSTADSNYAFSRFPSFNSCPFFSAADPIFNMAGTAEAIAAKPLGSFTQYDLTVPASATNPRSPFGTNPPEPPLPDAIDDVPMQDVLNDPIKLLQAVISRQQAHGHTFEGTVLNVATRTQLHFQVEPNTPLGPPPPQPPIVVTLPEGAGGLANIPFLLGADKGPNAQTVIMYTTFWIEKVMHASRPPFMQLQYAQMVDLDFPILTALPQNVVNLGWPHVSVGTLRKSFA